MEVVFSLKRQNEIIESCHSSVIELLPSKASSGHFGMPKRILLDIKIFEIQYELTLVKCFIYFCFL